jgi:hypothetical protein
MSFWVQNVTRLKNMQNDKSYLGHVTFGQEGRGILFEQKM